jgi:hypothetical protein
MAVNRVLLPIPGIPTGMIAITYFFGSLNYDQGSLRSLAMKFLSLKCSRVIFSFLERALITIEIKVIY